MSRSRQSLRKPTSTDDVDMFIAAILDGETWTGSSSGGGLCEDLTSSAFQFPDLDVGNSLFSDLDGVSADFSFASYTTDAALDSMHLDECFDFSSTTFLDNLNTFHATSLPSLSSSCASTSTSTSTSTCSRRPSSTRTTSTASISGPMGSQVQESSARPHYASERRYRASLNEKLAELSSKIPPLDAIDPEWALQNRASTANSRSSTATNKALILERAIRYIRYLSDAHHEKEEKLRMIKTRMRMSLMLLNGQNAALSSESMGPKSTNDESMNFLL